MQETKRGSPWLKLSLATLLFLVSLFCGALAGFRFGYQRGASAFLEADVYAKAYQVGDLVERRPLDDGTTVVDADRLIESIESIEPRTWMAHGGAGSVQFVPDKQFLVVSQNPWGHKQVELMLRTMRRHTFPRSYQVGKLPGSDARWSDDARSDLEALAQEIRATVAPESWTELGGKGSILCFETSRSLVVHHLDEVHQQVRAILEARRRNQLLAERVYDAGPIVAEFSDPNAGLNKIGELITTTINPSLWKQYGGRNELAIDAERQAVIVTADADTQLLVFHLLKQLLQDRSVAEMALAPARSE